MFKQELHPFYELLIKNDYSIQMIQSDHATWFELKCCDKTLFMNEEFKVVRAKDIIGQESRSLVRVQCDLIDKKQRIEFFIKEYINKIKASIDPQNISIMNMILFEIIQKYPDVSYVEFSEKKISDKKYGFLDQNNNVYHLECENLSNFLSNFCFIDSLSLSLSTKIGKFSNHELFEYAFKAKLDNKNFIINPKVEMMDM